MSQFEFQATRFIYNGGLPWPNPNPDDAGPNVRHSMGLPITAGCDTAWNRTRVCRDAFCTEMQCLRPLQHLGAHQVKYPVRHCTPSPFLPWFVNLLNMDTAAWPQTLSSGEYEDVIKANSVIIDLGLGLCL